MYFNWFYLIDEMRMRAKERNDTQKMNGRKKIKQKQNHMMATKFRVD